MDDVSVKHHGAVTGVTGSCHQYICPSANILIDCGLFQGKEAERDLADFPFDVSAVDALIVTHGHIDHVGRIPWLIAAGFRGPIVCTVPTARLLPVILRDALEIHVPDDRALVDSVMCRIEGQIVGVEFGVWVTALGVRALEDDPLPASPWKGEENCRCPASSTNVEQNGRNPASPTNVEQNGSNPASSMNAEQNGRNPASPTNAEQNGSNPASPGKGEENGRIPAGPANTKEHNGSPTFLGKVQKPAIGEQGNTSNGLCIRLQNAGHILGSAYIEVDYLGHRTVFSGDLGSPGAMFVEPPSPPERADILVIETTYGDRLHGKRHEREQALARLVNKALSDHGTLLIPAFSLGRTQELLSMFEHLLHTGQLVWPTDTPLPVILDSPLASELTLAYRSLAEYWPSALKARRDAGRLPLAFENLITVEHHGEHLKLVKGLKQRSQPAIVIAASGMCQGGRIVNYLQALAGDARADILFVGYQARGTLGRALQTGNVRELKKAGIPKLRAEVHSLSGFSAHADQADLLAFVQGMAEPPAEIRLVHGDLNTKHAFRTLLRKKMPGVMVSIPR